MYTSIRYLEILEKLSIHQAYPEAECWPYLSINMSMHYIQSRALCILLYLVALGVSLNYLFMFEIQKKIYLKSFQVFFGAHPVN